jgi:hypothetical protein
VGAVQDCERLEALHPGWCVSWQDEWNHPGWEHERGFYAWREGDHPLVKTTRGGYSRRPELYGADADVIAGELARARSVARWSMPLDVLGPAELAERLGLDRHRTYRISKRPDFPEPALDPHRSFEQGVVAVALGAAPGPPAKLHDHDVDESHDGPGGQ